MTLEIPMISLPPRSVDDAGRSSAPDPRVAAFCSPDGPVIFHAVAHRHEIWRPDPFDVESIHDEARAAFRRLVDRATTPPGLPFGRILLLLGESGCGKTHLMRALRNGVHARGQAYCGYMQMTSATDHYGRYVLNNLIDSLDQPYFEPNGATTGLMRLSTALAEGARGVAQDRLAQLREDDLDYGRLARLIDAYADQVVRDKRFDRVDFDLIHALLCLQRDDPRIKGRVLKYLRCEDLSDADRRALDGLSPRARSEAPQRLIEKLGGLMGAIKGRVLKYLRCEDVSDADRRALGGLVPRSHADAPRLIEKLGGLMGAIDSASLVLCLDQLEDMYNHEDAPAKFRRAMATVCDLADRVPSSVVVIACLEDFYKELRTHLAGPILDRIEKDPAPIRLTRNRSEEEVFEIVARRLEHLYDTFETEPVEEDPTFPIPATELKKHVGQSARELLEWCREYRERCIAEGRIVLTDLPVTGTGKPKPPTPPGSWEQLWNDFRSASQGEIPTEDEGLMGLLTASLVACSEEMPPGYWFSAEWKDLIANVERHSPGNAVDRLVVGLCNKKAQGGGLRAQVTRVTARASEHTPVVTPVLVRSTEFPSNPTAQITKQIGQMIAQGGRKAVVEDADWRTMLALKAFRTDHGTLPDFPAWLKEERPLSRLRSLRSILDLDHLPPPHPVPPEPPLLRPVEPATHAEPEPTRTPEPVVETGPVLLGVTTDRAGAPVVITPTELTRHAAFLGSSGSGKTTAAVNIVEQLLLRGIPAVLVDRKGDLCGYAEPGAWLPSSDDPALAERARRLRERLDVALYTPGNPNGRPLSIAIAPAGLGRLPSLEREQVARYAASALGGMMNYRPKGPDQARLAILTKAIDLLGQLEPDAAVTMDALVNFIHERDPALINAVGLLDTKLFDTLVQHLETQRLNRSHLLAAHGERLEAEALLGLGPHAVPGRTKLSIISTKFLGHNPDVQFWVSQLLVEMSRWASRSPSGTLQAVLLFDEADLYLPAVGKPPTKEPMENLLRRARPAGLGLLLATQSPGDFDYKCRDNIGSWFVGRIREQNSIDKMKPMLNECRVDIAAKLPGQEAGQFHLLRVGGATGLKAGRSALTPVQLSEERIVTLARLTMRHHP
jgi:ABC-type oligopeptide transport system ATPase subunit